ncbi:formimidoylglutamase [Rhodococcus hoagii]|jgi:formiminoglutamase|uniref:Formimidoylglutamase n=3 Tax=Rhodococcus hoagii TaxID=43767 RepID=E9T7G6_RHOHA|nr:formimidoylglutamase [Prescottella equi]MBU4615647.1 formimidoylglutamase [Rhodococcus sp. GG48]MCD7050863.1 formimidoylglutamase [Rhodococcus sp. BH2-1]GBF15765.1 formimidoylglutamase [Rhodococcus sp. Br-6]EGD21666.1 formimidoylglutamase [Prescottella equi ATCC 33707]ERN43790.1 formimidoylglutamase [Prescottella equi NBRC 101255 = C 7]
MTNNIDVDIAPRPWSGRTDGLGPEHLRWHQAVTPYRPGAGPGTVLIGFASDEGVRRNKGRQGAAAGPDALRKALSSMALEKETALSDAGTVAVTGDRLEEGQDALGRAVTTALDSGRLAVVLGGGHEVAYGTYLGVAGSALRQQHPRLGILNLDAHFDLRSDPIPSSGTPFRQIAEAEEAAGTSHRYDVIGISQPSNTNVLFDTAHRLGVRYLLDDHCGVADRARVDEFLTDFLGDVDIVYLTIDLDVLPAGVAPGVSAPAAYGVPLEIIQHVCDRVSASGKLAVVDVAELNPCLDVDNRTARTAARLIHRIVTGHVPPTA